MRQCYHYSLRVIGILALIQAGHVYAGIPLWTFTPLTATTISVSTSGSATIQYTVTNQSRRVHTLAMRPITGITQNTAGGTCANPFRLGGLQSCTLSLTITGSALAGDVKSGPVVCEQGSNLQCYQPTSSNSLNITRSVVAGNTTLTASVMNLALSVNDTALNPALTGNPRQITITNVGASAAANVTYSPSPALPSGTTISPASCGTLSPSGSCAITITPGMVPSAAAGDTNPVPITLTISGTNTNTLAPTINILTYGSVYQSGYVFAVDDTTPSTASIEGKVASLNNQGALLWSSNGSGAVSNVSILGIDELSTTSSPSPTAPAYPMGTPAYVACNGRVDGYCNSVNILAYYNFNRAAGGAAPTPVSQYAAGLCTATIDGYNDWYLPAICEQGYGISANCGTSGAPLLQNMQSSLVDNGDIGGLSGSLFWSSTEFSSSPSSLTWSYSFATGGLSSQSAILKSFVINTRCVRVVT